MNRYEIISASIGLLSVVFISIQAFYMRKSFKADHERRKKQETIEFTSQLRTNFYPKAKAIFRLHGKDVINLKDITEESEDMLKELLGYLEELSVGVNTGIFDLAIVDRAYGALIVGIYNKCLPYIEHVRKDRGINTIYSELETVAERIKDRRKVKNEYGKIMNS